MLTSEIAALGPNLLARLLNASSQGQIDEYAKSAWVLHGEGLLLDQEMAYLAPVIENCRRSLASNACKYIAALQSARQTTRFAPRQRPVIPDRCRAASWARRRMLAKSCPIPPCIARDFTVSKLAVLAIVAETVLRFGRSNLSLAELAGRAGVGCTIARYALREAAELGLITVVENRRRGQRNLPNTIRIISSAWCKWLAVFKKTRSQRGEAISSPPPADPLKNLRPTNDTYTIVTASASRSGVLDERPRPMIKDYPEKEAFRRIIAT
ncbi:hypothetical protein [Rhizobium sp. 18055]|uniref:hypothetical protein n=1 Tax=Rhizobium sp. 18055 TaxID=2681403 RepID=UPI00135A3F6A|nr:hypothetical protein [Rhizobium sp. 18055]